MRKEVLNKIKETFLNIFFPKFCVGCKTEGTYLCGSCTLFISEAGLICPSCGNSEFFGRRHKKCSKNRELNGLVSMWNYEGVIKDLICQAKYKSLIEIPKELIDYSFLTIGRNEKRFSEFISFLFDDETVITYVPIHEKKELSRGFDQSEVTANYLAKVTKKKAICLLKREKETKSQTKLNKEERFLNVRSAFSFFHKEEFKKVIIVDDVWTSGATMKECAKVLKRNGAKSVWGFTLARTP
jgi:competence protein ComFC